MRGNDMKKIIISGDIGYEVNPEKVRKQTEEAKGDDLEVQIASPGGFVYPGLEIYNIFSEYRRENPQAKINLTMKGLVASMASYIASNPAFDIVKAEDNAVYMMHNPYGFYCGDYRDMSKAAEILSGLTKLLAASYSSKSKKTMSDMRKLMDDETWYFGDEIKESGFVDELIQTGKTVEKTAAYAEARFKFSNLVKRMKESEQIDQDILKTAAYFEPEAALSVMNKSVSHARSLIKSGKVDKNSAWSFSSEDGNQLLGEKGDDWTNYALWHIGEDKTASEKTEDRYKYPYGKNGQVYRGAIIAVKQRAAAQGSDSIANVADALLQEIDKKKDNQDYIGFIDPLGPYTNEHAARIKDPDQYDSFARVDNSNENFKDLPDGVSAILGIKEGKSEVQAFRFSIDYFTAEEAKKWLDDHKIKYIEFVPAKNTKKSSAHGSDDIPAVGGEIKQEVELMDLNQIRTEHADLYAEIMKAGRGEELQRIKDVKEQLVPGHEALIDQFILDGHTTGAEAAKAIIKAEKELKEKGLSALNAAQPLPGATPPEPEGKKKVNPDAPIEERVKAEWDETPDVRKEFDNNYDVYLAFRKNEEAGNVRIKSGGTK